LNLTEAQHVILVEPQLHRSIELQAIARVRRLGQQYQTFVYRVGIVLFASIEFIRFGELRFSFPKFIVDDTAEEVVLADSRTAQTTSTHRLSSSVTEPSSISHRAASFADYELFYEITMARKIFYQSSIDKS
jgi:hypothetical protein